MKKQKTFWIVISLVIVMILIMFLSLKTITPEQLANFNTSIPLSIFTIIVALLDSFNPCNLFAFLLLLGILIQASQTRFRVYLIGAIFISVVYVFYFLVMAAWLNIFKLIGLIEPLRIGVGTLAIIAGIINCKELFFFNKGVSLMISKKHKELLYAKIRNIREIIICGKLPLLIATTVTLATFTSFIELICTSGFPVIYTSILVTKHASNSLFYYYYLMLYNLIYIIPLLFIIGFAALSIRSKQLSETQAAVIKFISGIVMVALGVILLIRPEIII